MSICSTQKIHLNKCTITALSFVLSPYIHHTYLRRTYFIEFTTRMNKTPALYYIFDILPFHGSSRCILPLFSFVACLSPLLFSPSLCSLAFLLSLFSIFCHHIASCLCSHCFLLVVALVTYFHCCFLQFFHRCCSHCLPSLLLFTLIIAFSTRYSHCLLSLHYYSLFSWYLRKFQKAMSTTTPNLQKAFQDDTVLVRSSVRQKYSGSKDKVWKSIKLVRYGT